MTISNGGTSIFDGKNRTITSEITGDEDKVPNGRAVFGLRSNLDIISGKDDIKKLMKAIYIISDNPDDDISDVRFRLTYVSYNSYMANHLGCQIRWSIPPDYTEVDEHLLINVIPFYKWRSSHRLSAKGSITIDEKKIPISVWVITGDENIETYPNSTVNAIILPSAKKDISTFPSVYSRIEALEDYNEGMTTFPIKRIERYSSNLFDKDDPGNIAGFLVVENGAVQPISNNPDAWITSGFVDLKGEADSIYIHSNYSTYSLAFYDSDKDYIQNSYKNLYNVSTYDFSVPENACFVRFTFHKSNLDVTQVNKGNQKLAYERYWINSVLYVDSDNKGNSVHFLPYVESDDLNKGDEVELLKPTKIYTVCNDLTHDEATAGKRNYAVALYLDHMVKLSQYAGLRFNTTNSDKFPVFSHFTSYGVISGTRGWVWNEDGSIVKETTKSVSINNMKDSQISFSHISTRNTATKGKKPIVLCIGDSVTEGYLANINKPFAEAPNAYWQWIKIFLEFDRHQNGDSDFESLFVGRRCIANFKGKYYDGTHLSMRACAEGKGGALLSEYLTKSTVGGAENYFWDGSKFSILHWLDQFRTMDDKGVRLAGTPGETIPGSDGRQYKIGERAELSNFDVCTPTHVIIQLGYNDGDRSGYLDDMKAMIRIIKSEIPGVVIGVSLPDCPGTYFPELYPQYGNDVSEMYPVSYYHGAAKGSHETFQSMNKKLMTLDDPYDNVYYIPTFFISPTAMSAPYHENNYASYLSSGALADEFRVQGFAAPNLHPNNHAHAAWGYEMYSWIKYTLAK